jgi:D-alanyl-lipoteichoic acid acyltransferase DltB (MBOAT superfamily)
MNQDTELTSVRGSASFMSLAHAVRFCGVIVQLALILAAIYMFRIEENFGFSELIPVIFIGFIVHANLSAALRLPFFLCLSLFAIVYLFGVSDGLGLIALGMALIGLAHLPIAFWLRVSLMLSTMFFLAAIRSGAIATPWAMLQSSVIPILASMFMFRMVLYLYDYRHERTPATVWERLSYFFMLPNACFPMFPVVDYATFRRTYFNDDEWKIYQQGLSWMCRGVVHLLLYRIVYHHLTPNLTDIDDFGGMVQFMVTSYLLYLRISGLFHLIVGVLCMFGFNLPETHKKYFLSASFNDFWRRINIYWKDFMMKMLYYPIFMKLRSRGQKFAIVVATFATLAISWLLHSYQWFWLRGSYPLTAQDGVFWCTLGVLVAINSIVEATSARHKQKAWSLPQAVRRAAQIVGMFLLMCFLWSFWTAPSVDVWLAIVGRGIGNFGDGGPGLLFGGALLVCAGVLMQYAESRNLFGLSRLKRIEPHWVVAITAIPLVVIASPPVHEWLGVSKFVFSITGDQLNRRDRDQMTKGYYEDLLDKDTFTSPLWSAQGGQPRDWVPIVRSDAVHYVNDLRVYALIPGISTRYHRAPLVTNSHGMRDQEYSLEKPPGTYRLAMLGASIEMGSGVLHSETYEQIVEQWLIESPPSGYRKVELLNFSVGGYSIIQHLYQLESALAFAPDAAIHVASANEFHFLRQRLRDILKRGVALEYDFLRELAARVEINPEMSDFEVERALEPYLDEVLEQGYREFVKRCRATGVIPIWLLVPRSISNDPSAADIHRIREIAEQTDFLMMSLENAYKDVVLEDLQVAPWDTHPNRRGHLMLAEEFLAKLKDAAPALGWNLANTPGDDE